MEILSATDVRKNWSVTLDSVVHERPVYVRRTHDDVAILGLSTLNSILSGYRYVADRYAEPDGSVTLSLQNMDLAANGVDEPSAKSALAHEIKEYSEEYYHEFPLWSAAPNRRAHIPYVLKALSLYAAAIAEEIICQNGRN